MGLISQGLKKNQQIAAECKTCFKFIPHKPPTRKHQSLSMSVFLMLKTKNLPSRGASTLTLPTGAHQNGFCLENGVPLKVSLDMQTFYFFNSFAFSNKKLEKTGGALLGTEMGV